MTAGINEEEGVIRGPMNRSAHSAERSSDAGDVGPGEGAPQRRPRSTNEENQRALIEATAKKKKSTTKPAKGPEKPTESISPERTGEHSGTVNETATRSPNEGSGRGNMNEETGGFDSDVP